MLVVMVRGEVVILVRVGGILGLVTVVSLIVTGRVIGVAMGRVGSLAMVVGMALSLSMVMVIVIVVVGGGEDLNF